MARGSLRAGHALGGTPARMASRGLRRLVAEELLPEWPENMPPAAPPRLPATSRAGAAAVYMPACINRIFGNPEGRDPLPTLPEAMVEVSRRAGVPVWIPDDVAGNCCATPWASKGYDRGANLMAERVANSVLRWSEDGALPVVIDASSCAHGLIADVGPRLGGELAERYARIEVLDSISWAHDRLLPALEVKRRVCSVALHPTCSVGHLGLRRQLQGVAEALAEEVVVPPGTTCCGFAGDRGMLHPEVPASALRDVATELDGRELDACLCSNRTCEIGLQQVTGRPYESFVLLLEELTR
jgi:D-lactate dehydrogenase